MSDVLVVPFVSTSVQVHRDDRVGVEVVTRTLSAVQIGRGIAHHEDHGVGFEVNCRCHPYATAKGFVEIAALLGQLCFFCVDVAQHIAVGGIVDSPNTFMAFFRNGVESPLQSAGLGVKGFHETTDTVFATVGADQDAAIDSHWCHGF